MTGEEACLWRARYSIAAAGPAYSCYKHSVFSGASKQTLVTVLVGERKPTCFNNISSLLIATTVGSDGNSSSVPREEQSNMCLKTGVDSEIMMAVLESLVFELQIPLHLSRIT